jgi:hypothetical protein
VTESSHDYFVTVDAETEVIRDGVRTLSSVRDEVQEAVGIRIPITWFVRFQRRWKAYNDHVSVEDFTRSDGKWFDAFELAESELRGLRQRGDEIGWHYHAYNYVLRTDLSHRQRMDLLRADLVTCAAELKARHPHFDIHTFRFGWFFVPDYEIFNTLSEIGIKADASVRPQVGLQKVPGFDIVHLPAITAAPAFIGRLHVVPFERTMLVHDDDVVPHKFGWSKLGHLGAARARARFRRELTAIAVGLRRTDARFVTYEAFVQEGGNRCRPVPVKSVVTSTTKPSR